MRLARFLLPQDSVEELLPASVRREARRPNVLRERRAASFLREPTEDVIRGVLRLGGSMDQKLAISREAS